MHQNYGKLQAGRGPLPRTLGVLIALLLFVSNASAQDPDASLAASVRIRVDPQGLNLTALGPVDLSNMVFANPISFRVSLWTDNTLTLKSDVASIQMDFSQQDVRSFSLNENMAATTSYKGTVPGSEVSGGATAGSATVKSTSGTITSGWHVSDEIHFELRGNLVVAVVTATVASIKRTYEIELGTLDTRDLFKTCPTNTHLDGHDWLAQSEDQPVPAVITENGPASINPLLDYTAFGKRGFIDPHSGGGTFPAWRVRNYWLYRVYSGNRLVRMYLEAEYESVQGVEVRSVILKQSPYVGSVQE